MRLQGQGSRRHQRINQDAEHRQISFLLNFEAGLPPADPHLWLPQLAEILCR